jgi:hypothetical protein
LFSSSQHFGAKFHPKKRAGRDKRAQLHCFSFAYSLGLQSWFVGLAIDYGLTRGGVGFKIFNRNGGKKKQLNH